jgi:hypothetical protein
MLQIILIPQFENGCVQGAAVCMHMCIEVLKLQVASRACCAYRLLPSGFFLGVFFSTEDVGELFQVNVS